MLPGIELAEKILQTDGVQAMQLVVFLVVLGWVLATWAYRCAPSATRAPRYMKYPSVNSR